MPFQAIRETSFLQIRRPDRRRSEVVTSIVEEEGRRGRGVGKGEDRRRG
jgi:hypothetical protein